MNIMRKKLCVAFLWFYLPSHSVWWWSGRTDTLAQALRCQAPHHPVTAPLDCCSLSACSCGRPGPANRSPSCNVSWSSLSFSITGLRPHTLLSMVVDPNSIPRHGRTPPKNPPTVDPHTADERRGRLKPCRLALARGPVRARRNPPPVRTYTDDDPRGELSDRASGLGKRAPSAGDPGGPGWRRQAPSHRMPFPPPVLLRSVNANRPVRPTPHKVGQIWFDPSCSVSILSRLVVEGDRRPDAPGRRSPIGVEIGGVLSSCSSVW